MDQAACLHGVAGHALRIEFDPLRVTPVPVPEGMEVGGGVVAGAGGEVRGRARNDITRGRGSAGRRWRKCGMSWAWSACHRGHSATANLVSAGDPRPPAPPRPSHPRRRCCSAASATWSRRAAGWPSPSGPCATATCLRFGHLMVRSHQSLRDDYEVSTGELDAIVESGARTRGRRAHASPVPVSVAAPSRSVTTPLHRAGHGGAERQGGSTMPRLGGPPTARHAVRRETERRGAGRLSLTGLERSCGG